MTIQEINFIYNGQTSEEHNVILCKFDNSPTSSNDEEAEITNFKTYGSDIFHLINIDYSMPLQFPLTICKPDGTYFDSEEQREIKKWLCRKNEYGWLYIDQDDLNDIRYKCIMTFAGMVDISGKNGGMTFNVQCDSPYAYSFERNVTKTCTAETLTFDLFNDSDFAESDKMLYPNIRITSNINGTINIKNNTTNETMIFTQCSNGEIINISSDEIISTTANRSIIDYWNYTHLYFIDGSNNVTITGNCKVEITYSSPQRVGG